MDSNLSKGLLYNLRLLRADMISNDWLIDAFIFLYKTRKYIVLIKLYEEGEYKPPYSLLKLEFISADNFDRSLEVTANIWRINVDAKTLREFFGIEFGENLGDIFSQFYSILGKQIPTQVNKNRTIEEKQAISRVLSEDSSESEKIYCFAVRRNPKRSDGRLGQRSKQNEEKAKVLYPDLFRKLRGDKSLSFCFSENPELNKSYEDILEKWIHYSNSRAINIK